MKKLETYKLWWRIPCALFTLVGLFMTVLFTYYVIDECPIKRNREHRNYLSPVVLSVTNSDGTSLVNAKTNKTIIEHVVYYSEPFDTIMCVYSKSKFGYINLNTGHIDVPLQYDHAWVFSEGLAAVVQDGRMGFIRPDGSKAVPMNFVYNPTLKHDYLFKNGYCIVADSINRFGVIDTLGNWIVKPAYEKIEILPDYFVASNTGDFNKQIAFDGHIINNYVIENVFDLSYDINVYNPSVYYEIEETIVNQKYFKYAVNKRMGLMDNKGNFITPPIYTNLYGFGPYLFRAVLLDKHSEVIIDTRGNVVSDK